MLTPINSIKRVNYTFNVHVICTSVMVECACLRVYEWVKFVYQMVYSWESQCHNEV